jgi:hypothetical protein
MHGDFSRDSFDRTRHLSRVLYQQGRVMLDADPNEQTSILLHYLRTLAADIIGPHGMPGKGKAFAVQLGVQDGTHTLTIGPGHYYVDGILCENDEEERTYVSQTDLPAAEAEDLEVPFLAYLDVWEAFVPSSAVEGREVALGSIDTSARARVVWQVKIIRVGNGAACDNLGPDWDKLTAKNRGSLRARIAPQEEVEDNCKVEAGGEYRGLENQLYRVEIHTGGTTADHPTFKWSRDNGALVFPVRSLSKGEATLESLGEDATRSLRVRDWVEIVDDARTLRGEPGILAQVAKVSAQARKVTLQPAKADALAKYENRINGKLLLRRWDHHGAVEEDGAIAIQQSDDPDAGWYRLEDDVEIQFWPAADIRYRPGDYWLIPARVGSTRLDWPVRPGTEEPAPKPPQGIEHHYAPLGIVTAVGAAGVKDCRRCLGLHDTVGQC